ncbi:VOC family protein [Phytohabitans kaempferiae]|uniref:VOC family protein n=1 Tax=Phytohabitans kaempferiae TaxID=1620943 RepID=A0ABV6M277_9ACTN
MTQDYRFHHLAIIARNYAETVGWYCRHFGFSLAQEWTAPDMLPGARMCYLRKGTFFMEIIGDGEKAGHHQVAEDPRQEYQIPGYRHFALEVDDVDAAVKTLEGDGVPVFFPPATLDGVGVRAALVRDPDGNTVELIQWLRGRPGEAEA